MISHSQEETLAIAQQLSTQLKPGAVIALYGDLGAGKTTFVRGLLMGLRSQESLCVCSPTFNYLNIYQASPPLYHFDLYRLNGPGDFFALGFDEYLYGDGICCIEWPERLADRLPKTVKRITISHLDDEKRQIEIEDESH